MSIAEFRRPQAAVSGSFRRHLSAVQAAVEALRDQGVAVLSPADPHVVDAFGDFVFVSSDRRRSIKGVQSRHLEAIAHSDFLWLVCPDGYVGPSAAMEVGFAVSARVPIYSDVAPSDWTLRQFVTPVGSVQAACELVRRGDLRTPQDALLLDPDAALESVRREIDRVEAELNDRTPRQADPIDAPLRRARALLRLPGTK